MSVYTTAEVGRPILVPRVQKTSPSLPQTTYRVSRGADYSPSMDTNMDNPLELQRVGLLAESFDAALIDQPGSARFMQHDFVAETSAPGPYLVSTVPRDRQILEDIHTSRQGNIVLLPDMHPADYEIFSQARPTSPCHPSPQTHTPRAIDDMSAGTLPNSSPSLSSVHSSIDTALAVSFVNNWFLDPQLQERASAIMNSAWFISNGREPRLHEEELVRYGLSRQEYSGSLFDQFIDTNPKYGCLFFNDNGRCPHQASRPGRARSHAHSHFSYAPFACVGHCGKVSWSVCTHTMPTKLITTLYI